LNLHAAMLDRVWYLIGCRWPASFPHTGSYCWAGLHMFLFMGCCWAASMPFTLLAHYRLLELHDVNCCS
ncbi:hypothetical protein Dimus_011233, partial [Dionaea muscipula]